MDQGRVQRKADITMGECSEYSNIRPRVQDMMGNEAISNLERVLAMNSSTIQQTGPGQPGPEGFKPLELTNGQYNAYLYNSMMQSLAAQQAQAQTQPLEFQSPPQPHSTAQPTEQTLPTGFPPYVQYPFLPFWTACPLPFSPLAYPQIIIPPAMATPQPVGPQLLRPVPPVQQMPIPNFPGTIKHDYQPIRPKVATGSAETKEEKLNRYKEKRSKRLWSRPPDQRLSQIAQERPRDQSGKFVSTKSPLERERELKGKNTFRNLLKKRKKH